MSDISIKKLDVLDFGEELLHLKAEISLDVRVTRGEAIDIANGDHIAIFLAILSAMHRFHDQLLADGIKGSVKS